MKQLRNYKHLKGHKYFFDALRIISKNEIMLYEIMSVYKIIAKRYKVSPESVRKAISRFVRKIEGDGKPSEYIADWHNKRKF
jgi:hypothetical protein